MRRTIRFALGTMLALLMLPLASLRAQEPAFLTHTVKNNPDGTVDLIFDISIENGWYVYGTVPVPNGPMPASVELAASPDYEPAGSLTETTPSHTKFDNGFGVEVTIFEGQAVLTQRIRPLKAGDLTVSATISFQTCNGAECLTTEQDVEFRIKSSGAATGKQQGKSSPAATGKPGETDSQSLWMFLLIAFAAGLGGVITPCVFPMIPMTVGFFIGGGDRKSGPVKGIIFALSVTLIYTVLGLVVSLFQSTAATDAIGTHWIPNLIFALLFLIFAISFLGAFEITLPAGLANKADRQADKGGYIAAFFVAFAMVIVSFSCTGPFVGSILAAAVVDGVALKPILGMAVFGFAFSLPFLVFSFFPGIMSKMPKSGGWLNVVKVLFAFILLGFALKFFYNVDAYFGWGILTRTGFLCVWTVLSLLLGLYFLGKIRTDHDTPVESVGWGRLVAAIACFCFSVYLFTGLLGAPLKSIAGLIPPQDESTEWTQPAPSADAQTAGTQTVSGYRALPSVNNIDDALAQAAVSGKKVFLYFKSHTCSVCKVMESTVLNDPEILRILSENYVIANLYVDDKTPDTEEKTLGRRLRKYQTTHFGIASQPLYVVTDASGNPLRDPAGSSTLEEFKAFLQ